MYGATSLPNFLRKPHVPGWSLVGDAGSHKDPFRARGVCDAFRDAELLADAIADVVAGTRPEEEALAGYERTRNEATLADYHENLQHARLGAPPAELLERRAAIRGDEERIRDFYYASEGLAPVA